MSRRRGYRFNRGRAPIGGSNPFAIQTAQNGWAWDTAVFTPTGSPPNDYVDHDNFARYVLDMPASATRLDIQAVVASSDRAYVGVYVNGNYYTQATFSGVGTKTVQSVTLPVTNGATKRIELEEMALVTGLGGPVTILSATTPQRRIFFWNASLGAGYLASPFFNAVGPTLRHIVETQYAVRVHGIYGQSLHGLAATSGQRATLAATFAANLEGTVSNDLWLCSIAYNDQSTSQWLASDYKTAYKDLIQRIQALVPGVTVWVQSSIPLGIADVANTFGEKLSDFRAIESTMVTELGAGVNFVDGTAMGLNAANFPDNLHPSSSEHQKWAAYIAGRFNFSKATITGDAFSSTISTTASLTVTNPASDPSTIGGGAAICSNPQPSIHLPSSVDGLAVDKLPNLGSQGATADITQATGSKQPLRKDGLSPNGKRGVLFDGVDDFLRVTGLTLNQVTHVFVVGQGVVGAIGSTVCDGGSSQTGRYSQSNASGTNMNMNAGTSRSTGAVCPAITTAFKAELLWNGANSTLIINGITELAAGNSGSNNMSGVTLGCRGDGLGAFNGYIFDYAAFTSELTGGALISMRAYMDTV